MKKCDNTITTLNYLSQKNLHINTLQNTYLVKSLSVFSISDYHYFEPMIFVYDIIYSDTDIINMLLLFK